MRPLSGSRCIQRACLSAAFLVSTHGGPSFGQTTSAKPLPLAWVLSASGTISGRGSSPTDLSNYRSGGVLGEDVVKGVPQISQFATVKVDQIVNVGSPDITTENRLTIATRLSAVFADPPVAGVVVTHGTSTLEETA